MTLEEAIGKGVVSSGAVAWRCREIGIEVDPEVPDLATLEMLEAVPVSSSLHEQTFTVTINCRFEWRWFEAMFELGRKA